MLVKMGVELAKKYVSIAMRSCYRSVWRHPFMVVMALLLIWMYRSFPVLFYLLMYASPVIVSTAILLGTLLLFGKETKPHHHEIHNLKTGDTEIDWRSGCEDTHGVRSRVREKGFGEKTSAVDNHPSLEIYNLGSSVDDGGLRTKMKSRKEAESEVGNQKTDVAEHKVVSVNPCSLLSKAKDTELKGDPFDPSHCGPDLLWKGVERHTDEDNKGWETGSELAESSSPTASMADIFPMLDEIHPLLEPEVPQRTRVPSVSRYPASDHSLESTDNINETDDYDDDDQEEEEEEHVDKEVETGIRWIEDDQKNLMHLGTSQHERNQHMENLIARQQAIRNMRMQAEKNMVNSSPDLPFNTTLISTTRKSPDLHYDSNENILGSAPSVMVPRINHFGQPYDPREEKPDTIGVTFQSHSIPFQPNDPLCRPHESFDVGPSALGASRQESQGFNLGPSFVPKGIASDQTGYSSMHGQAGELSDSKVSSTHDIESISSVDDLEHNQHIEDDSSREADLTYVKECYHTSEVSEHVSQRSQLSEDEETVKLGQVAKGDGRLNEEKMSAGDETGYQDNTSSEWSSSSLSDVTDHIYIEKEGEKNLGSVPEMNYFVGSENSTEKSDMQLDESKGHQASPTRHAKDQHAGVPDDKGHQAPPMEKTDMKQNESKGHHVPPTRYAQDQHAGVPDDKGHQAPLTEKSAMRLDESRGPQVPPTRYAEDQPVVEPDDKGHQTPPTERFDMQRDESKGHQAPPTRYVEDQPVVVPDDKGHHVPPTEMSDMQRDESKGHQAPPTRHAEDQPGVVPDDKGHHVPPTEKSDMRRDESKGHLAPPTRHAEDQPGIVPDDKGHRVPPTEKSDMRRDESKGHQVPPTRHAEDQPGVVPDDKGHQAPPTEKSDKQLDESKGHQAPPTRYAEDLPVVVPSDKEEQLAVEASSHHNGTSEDKIVSEPEELSLADRSMDKPLTQGSKELQVQEQEMKVEDVFSDMGTTSPASTSNMNGIETNDVPEKSDYASDDAHSSVYASGSNSDTDQFESDDSAFETASESDSSGTDEPVLPQKRQGLRSWLTGWKA